MATSPSSGKLEIAEFGAANLPRRLLARFFWRGRRATANGARAAHQFAGSIKNRIASLLPARIVTVHDPVQKSAVRCALRFFQKPACVIVLVPTFEFESAVRSRNFAGGETSGGIKNITNCLTDFALGISGCRHCFTLWAIEIVNGA